ncbi:hypothetical protein C8Q75DRAFT_802132 [Abortiporus biennis]|nr:hypothetical protein C8Q75DRAFT_802132 [Abortiporus biennis]
MSSLRLSINTTMPGLSTDGSPSSSNASTPASSAVSTPATSVNSSTDNFFDKDGKQSSQPPTEPPRELQEVILSELENLATSEASVIREGRGIPGSLVNLARRAKTYARRLSVSKSLRNRRRRSGGEFADSPSRDLDIAEICNEETKIESDAAISTAVTRLDQVVEQNMSPPAKPESPTNSNFLDGHFANISSTSLLAVLGSPPPVFDDEISHSLFSHSSNNAFTKLAINVVRTILFAPWLILIGGAILACPNHLSKLAPVHSPFTPPMPQPGPHRFAYWAECAYYHVFIFFSCLVGVACYNLSLGALLIFGLMAAIFSTWYGYSIQGEGDGIRLGEDDMQSCYLVATKLYMDNEAKFVCRGIPIRGEELAVELVPSCSTDS